MSFSFVAAFSSHPPLTHRLTSQPCNSAPDVFPNDVPDSDIRAVEATFRAALHDANA